jgi:hypothetical protein
MSDRSAATRAAFRRLERDLTRRRIAAIDPMLRFEVAALALLGTGFVFWQTRIPLDGLIRDAGPVAYLITAAAGALFLAMLAGMLSGGRLAAALRSTPDGPAWLALPVDSLEIERHLAWNALAQAIPLLVVGAGFVIAAIGLVPLWWLPPVAGAGAAVVWLGARAGCRIAVRWVARDLPAAVDPRGTPDIARVLAARGTEETRARLPAAAWRHGAAWRAIFRKDARWLSRPSRARRMWPAAVGLALLSFVAWRLPVDIHAARFVAFALGLLAAAAFAEWIVELTGSDPFAVMRGLPLSLVDVWGARALWVLLFAVGLVLGHLVAGAGIPHAANPVFLVWLLFATICIGLLGVHYGMTLFPNTEVATRLLGLSLALAIAASIMLPMVGWVLLLTAVLHSMRRLPRWSRLEDL